MQFLYPTFLYALFALAIPLIIHLFHFRRYKKITFSDLRFLQQIQDQTRSNRKLKEWLMLLCRLALITALVFAFAQPVLFKQKADYTSAREQLHTSIFIDNSLSMMLEGEEGILLEHAKVKAKSVVEALPENAAIQVITHQQQWGSNRPLSAKEALEKIQQIEPVQAHKLPEQVYEQQLMWFEKWGGSGQAFWLSDFQETAFESFETRMPDTSHVFGLIPLSANRISNIVLDTAYLDRPVVALGEKVNVTVVVKQYGGTATQLPVTLSINGIKKGVVNANVGKDGSTQVTFLISANAPLIQAEVKIDDAPITYDDVLYLLIKPVSTFNVLAINGSVPNRYITSLLSVDDHIRLTQMNEKNIDYNIIHSQSLVVLNELSQLTSGLILALTDYVSKGGTVCIIPSAVEMANERNNTLLENWCGITWEKLSKTALTISELDKRDKAFVAAFSKLPQQADFPKIFQYFPITYSQPGYAKFKLNNGDAFIVERTMGMGRVQVLCQPLQPEFGNFTQHALFVPYLLTLSKGVKAQSGLYHVLQQGEITLADVSGIESEKTITLLYDKQKWISQVRKTSNSYRLWIEDSWDINGFAELQNSGNGKSLGMLAFNAIRNESNPQPLSDEALSNLQQKLGTKTTRYNQSTEALGYELVTQQKGRPLWRYFILIAIIMALCEMLISRYMKS